MACFRELYRITQSPVHVVKWDQKTLTPFIAKEEKGIFFYNRSGLTVAALKHLVDKFPPAILYVVGRMDPGYLETAVYARKKNVITISGWDNQWHGNLRNYAASLGSRWLYKPYFDFIMVAGIWQYEYIRHLGYSRSKILFDQYSCDYDLFNKAYLSRQANGFRDNKKILFVGRLTEIKGVLLLNRVFRDILNEGFHDWELIIVGNGNLRDRLQEDGNIKIISFTDQEQIVEILTDITFFCLPSYNEPWGVVIHEMAVAGIPMITSDRCGASTLFLKESYNGFKFQSGNAADLKDKLKRMMNLDQAEKEAMSIRSHELSKQINPTIWAKNILSVLRPINKCDFN